MTIIKTLHVFDFDGTIVDSSHRYRTQIGADGIERIDLQYWIDNEHRTLEDSLLPMAETFRELVRTPTDYVMIATARIWCELSQQFVIKHDLTPNAVVARKGRDDTRGGAALKISAIKRLLNLKQFQHVETIKVYEDNAKYLADICHAFPTMAKGYFFPSNQGH